MKKNPVFKKGPWCIVILWAGLGESKENLHHKTVPPAVSASGGQHPEKGVSADLRCAPRQRPSAQALSPSPVASPVQPLATASPSHHFSSKEIKSRSPSPTGPLLCKWEVADCIISGVSKGELTHQLAYRD